MGQSSSLAFRTRSVAARDHGGDADLPTFLD
jgi:hypothetical protein